MFLSNGRITYNEAIVANHELLGAIDPLFPPTRGFSWPVSVYIGHTEIIRSSASVGDCFACHREAPAAVRLVKPAI